MDDSTNPAEQSQPTEDTAALVPRPDETRHAPPIDVDEREGPHPPTETIPLPGHDDTPAPEPSPGDLADQIDETLPIPSGEPVDEDEPTPEDDLDTQIEETLPDADAPRDESTTLEDLDPETAHHLEEEREDAPGAGIDDDLPLNDESVLFAAGPAATAAPPREPEAEPGEPLPETTICPTCGRETPALRFCGFCGATLTEAPRERVADSPLGRLQEQAGIWLEPLGEWTRPASVRIILGTGAALVLLALLANSGGLALMIGAAILPLILIFSFIQRDVFETEPPLIIAGLGLGGVLAGAVLGSIGAWIVARNWFDEGVLNFGAAGFGGRFAEAAGSAPFSVWAINGVILPLLAIAAIAGLPIALRQSMSLRNEVMDGLTLAGAVAGGVSLGTAMVFAAPMLRDGGPALDASGWTLTTIGLTILRPLIWTLSGAALGAGAWRYMLQPTLGSILMPAIVGVGAPLLFTFVAIQLAPAGLWPEFLWGLVVAVAVAVLYRMILMRAIAHDRRILGTNDARIVCPNCRRVTPRGSFCAHCGHALP